MPRAGRELQLLAPVAVAHKPQNGPKSPTEQAGLRSVAETGKGFYTEETLAGRRYFTAFYPDKAIIDACVDCHNHHDDSPRKDFVVGDVMGSVVIRIQLER